MEKQKAGKEIVGSFEKAVPVIFKPCDVTRTLFPWLLTALYPFHGASERADADAVAMEVPKLPAIKKLQAAAVGLCRSEREVPGNGGAQ